MMRLISYQNTVNLQSNVFEGSDLNMPLEPKNVIAISWIVNVNNVIVNLVIVTIVIFIIVIVIVALSSSSCQSWSSCHHLVIVLILSQSLSSSFFIHPLSLLWYSFFFFSSELIFRKKKRLGEDTADDLPYLNAKERDKKHCGRDWDFPPLLNWYVFIYLLINNWLRIAICVSCLHLQFSKWRDRVRAKAAAKTRIKARTVSTVSRTTSTTTTTTQGYPK